MTARHNLCVNPALKNNNTGWGGDSTPARTDVTGEGFDRQFAARYTAGTFARTPAGAVTPGLAYTLSFSRYVGGAAGGGGNTIYIEWTRSSGGPVYDSAGTSWTALAVQRFSITATAPALATTAALIIDGPYATRTIDISQVLIEQAASLDTYFDGDTFPGGSWDGTSGNSASTLNLVQSAAAGTATETATARPLGRVKTKALGTAIETATALTIGRTKRRTLAVATETATALHMGFAGQTITVSAGIPERAWEADPPQRAWAAGTPQRTWTADLPQRG